MNERRQSVEDGSKVRTNIKKDNDLSLVGLEGNC